MKVNEEQNSAIPSIEKGAQGDADARMLGLEELPRCPSVEQQDMLIAYLKTASQQDLIARMRDKEFRGVVNSVFIYWKMRTQIRVMRLQRGWTQKELARRTGFQPSMIARFENIYYPVGVCISTLQRFARAFDVRLVVEFCDWGSLLKDIADMSDESLRVSSFDDDPMFGSQATKTGD